MQAIHLTFMALLLAHLLGDFRVQAKSMGRNKEKQRRTLMVHGITHLALAWACVLVFAPIQFLSYSNQIIITGCVIVHLMIDQLRHKLIARKTLIDSWKTFLADQSLHIVALTISALLLVRTPVGTILQNIQLTPAGRAHILEIAIIYVSVVFGGGYLIRYLTKDLANSATLDLHPQLGNAGLYVGWIERFLIVTAIVMQSPALVGLILTSKSIARFPEFKEARFAEYFLIGTLLSVSLSVLGGIVLLYMTYGTVSFK